ncbi:hypothetical protein PUN28_014741 [Cardiocondyla obscurior]|uniref:Uncharacterized protein n=1 Tax=Cardiocondyla obscurior TaxID=286306 RepID=A0AAW2F073_9HYME
MREPSRVPTRFSRPGLPPGARARDRDNDRREPHTRLAHVRAARAVNANRVFFILGATSPPHLSPHLLPPSTPPPPPPLLAAVTAAAHCHQSSFRLRPLPRRGALLRGDFALFSSVFHRDTFAAF